MTCPVLVDAAAALERRDKRLEEVLKCRKLKSGPHNRVEFFLGGGLSWRLFFIFVFSIQLIIDKNLPMTGFEPRISGIGSNRTTTVCIFNMINCPNKQLERNQIATSDTIQSVIARYVGIAQSSL